MHYMARFIDMGLNPMYMDTDFTAQSNFYRRVPLSLAAESLAIPNALTLSICVWCSMFSGTFNSRSAPLVALFVFKQNHSSRELVVLFK
jgi:hypothetical protein